LEGRGGSASDGPLYAVRGIGQELARLGSSWQGVESRSDRTRCCAWRPSFGARSGVASRSSALGVGARGAIALTPPAASAAAG